MLQTVTVKTVANVSVAKHVDILRHHQKETSKRMFYLTYDEAKLIDIHLPNQIYLPVGEDAYKVPAKIQKDKTYDPNKLDYIYCKRERISWKTFFSEREYARL